MLKKNFVWICYFLFDYRSLVDVMIVMEIIDVMFFFRVNKMLVLNFDYIDNKIIIIIFISVVFVLGVVCFVIVVVVII